MGLEDLQHNFLTGRLEDLVKWARTYSMWPATFGLACCAIEMMAVGAADFDLARFGMEVFRASEARKTSMPKRARSKSAAPTAIISMAQQARPNVAGHIEWVLSLIHISEPTRQAEISY